MAIVQSDGVLSASSSSLLAGRMAGGAGLVPWYNGLFADYASIYRTQPNVRLVTNFLARNIAQLNLRPFLRVSDSERESLGSHPLGQVIRRPNPLTKTTRYRFILALVSDLCIYDQAFFLKTRNEATGRLHLWRLPPNLMQPETASLWEATAWRFLGLADQPVFSSDDIVHLHGYNPDDARVGLSPMETIRQTLAESQAASEYREQFWKGGARISGVIKRPATAPKWSPEAKNRFLAEWAGAYTGNAGSAGGTPMLEEGMEFEQVAFSAKDSEYIAARKLSREEVAAFYHVSPLFVGILENANFSNVKEQHRHLYQDTLGPTLKMIEEDLVLQLVSEYTDLDMDSVYLEFDLRDKLRGSFEEEAAAIQTAVGAPIMTRNEGRAQRNLPPIEGGDEIVTPLNVLIGGQASPTDSAPDGSASFTVGIPLRTASRMKELPSAATKEADELPDDVKDWFDQHVEMLTSTFDRQKNAVVSALGGGASISDVWDEARWNTELHADFLSLASEMGGAIGAATAEALSGEFDPEAPGVNEYLDENSRIGAENVNFATKSQLDELDADSDGFLDDVRTVFEVAATTRAAQIAVSRVTGVSNFARKEGAQQGGAQYKVWNVRSRNSRHPNMNGQRVGIDEEFSNGARWPGDATLPDDQRAGCVCDMTFE